MNHFFVADNPSLPGESAKYPNVALDIAVSIHTRHLCRVNLRKISDWIRPRSFQSTPGISAG
jgi:hypothetical protein